ncbi:hypothetical protein PACTADRAFT_33848 [Pachysolen tannophilus NRRL Y-2460]|uniref:Uncharacterized protein n=1 Tax=Pachysolen tannophilus NRRL Y-2460 TaxID=669874 RepID=A0A1E4TU64_PACTA|nr:hypothetical protein PACTADRAFT_33848 [Pachysolen tannophilus NRRL Y-2460]
MYPRANCHVSGGKVCLSGSKAGGGSDGNLFEVKKGPISGFINHNFVNQLDLILPLEVYSQIKDAPILNDIFTHYRVRTKLCNLLNKQLLDVIGAGKIIKLITINKNSETSDIFISIIDNKLCLSLDKDNSERTGLKFTKSIFKKNNRYNYIFDFKTIGLNVNNNDFLKILRFLQLVNINDAGDYEFLFYITEKNGNPYNLTENELLQFKDYFETILPINYKASAATNLNSILIPSLEINNNDLKPDPEWCLETMEFLTYLSIGGSQLYSMDKTDPFISNFKKTIDFSSETTSTDIIKITFKNGLIHSAFISLQIISLINNLKISNWYSIINYGLLNTNYSWNLSEHLFHENGENHSIFLQNKDDYIQWQVTGGLDTH